MTFPRNFAISMTAGSPLLKPRAIWAVEVLGRISLKNRVVLSLVKLAVLVAD
jgi:hypothetical protein